MAGLSDKFNRLMGQSWDLIAEAGDLLSADDMDEQSCEELADIVDELVILEKNAKELREQEYSTLYLKWEGDATEANLKDAAENGELAGKKNIGHGKP